MSAEHEDFKSESTPVVEPEKIDNAQPGQITNVTTLPLIDDSVAEADTNPAEDWAEEQTQVLREEDDEHLNEAWLLIGDNAPVKIESFPFTLGRAKSSSLSLNGNGVSRHHADILYQGGRYLIVDQQSLNGVEVNGYIVSRVLLEDGDQIKIGDQTIRFTHRHPQSNLQQQSKEGSTFTYLIKGMAISFATVAVMAVGYFGYQRLVLEQRAIKLPFDSISQVDSELTASQTGNNKGVVNSVTAPKDSKTGMSREPSRPSTSKMMLTNSRTVATVSATSTSPKSSDTTIETKEIASTKVDVVDKKPSGNLSKLAEKQAKTEKAQTRIVSANLNTKKQPNQNSQTTISRSDNSRVAQTRAVDSSTQGKIKNSQSFPIPGAISAQQAENSSNQSIVVAKTMNQEPITSMAVERARSTLQQSTANGATPTEQNLNDGEFSFWRQQSINQLREGSEVERRRAAVEIAEESIQTAEEKYLAGEGGALLDVLSELEQSPYLNENRKLDVQAVLEWLRPLYGKFSEGERYYNRADKEVAFAKWELFLAEESKRFDDRSSVYADRVATKVVQEYLLRAEEAYDQSRYHEAFALWQRAVFIDGNDEAKLKLAEMEMKARELYRKALRAETVNASQARRYWQEVINFVPPGTEYYTKAKAKLAWYVHWGS